MTARLVILAVAALSLRAADPVLDRANAKLDRIDDGKAKPGEVIFFTLAEINAWARDEVPIAVPQGIRDLKVELGNGTGTGSAMVDFVKIEQSRGKTPGLIAKMFAGERPLKVSLTVESGGGKCTVHVTRVDIGGTSVEGTLLDLLIRTFFKPLYPDAKVEEPFEIGYNVDRIELRPDGIRVTMTK